MEDRTLLAFNLTPGPNINVSRLNDSQAEATIALHPTLSRVFVASNTMHGSYSGVFAPEEASYAQSPNLSLPGLAASYSSNPGSSTAWNRRIMATGHEGGPLGGDSLPAAESDPQAVYDRYGNLYLTYVTSPDVAVGRPSAPTETSFYNLTDATRNWLPGSLKGMQIEVTFAPWKAVKSASAIRNLEGNADRSDLRPGSG